MNTKEILAKIEESERVATETKKLFFYDKSKGTWSWVDRGEEHELGSYHNGFKTRYRALADAVEPYATEIEYS